MKNWLEKNVFSIKIYLYTLNYVSWKICNNPESAIYYQMVEMVLVALSLVLWLLMTGIVKKLLVHLQKHWTINWHTQTYLYNVHGNAETHTKSTYITAIINRKMSELQFHQHIKKTDPPSVYLCTRHSKSCSLISIIRSLFT